MEKIIGRGAEAILTLKENQVTKDRVKKSYRISFLDEKLRKSRTKSEAKIIKKLESIIPVPKLIKTDDKEKIVIEFIKGEKISESLEKLDYKKICRLIGNNISKMHDAGIIHGDLTTSNMIYVKNLDDKRVFDRYENATQNKKHFRGNKEDDKVYFIDFGLAFHSQKIEDKAVDLHLLQQALEAKHFTIWKDCLKIILKEYEKSQEGKQVLERIKIIESRGRYKDKY